MTFPCLGKATTLHSLVYETYADFRSRSLIKLGFTFIIVVKYNENFKDNPINQTKI